jgi:hypothetical protein
MEIYFSNCRGCVALGRYEGKTVCYNLVQWTGGDVPENPPCHETPESQETPEYKARIEAIKAIVKAQYGVTI